MAAAGGSEQKELLALMHQHLVQIGYERAARELLAQSGQKTFLPPPVTLGDIFTQWKKTSPQAQKRKAEEIKQGSPAKIRVPDPKSSTESSEEEAAKPIRSTAAVNNNSRAKAESSSGDEESSSEEEEASGKDVKVSAAGNKTSNLLQLAAQKSNSFPGKGVAVAAVQAKGQQKKATGNKPPTLAVTKAGQNKILPVKPGSASQPLATAGQNASQATAPRKRTNSESSSSSSSSESEEEKTPAAVKTPVPKPAVNKAESSSGDSSDDSDSEEEANTVTLQVKPAAESRQLSTTLTKSVPATAIPSKGNAVKPSPAKKTAQQTRAGYGSVAKTSKPADSSETSDSSDTDIEEPSAAAQQAKSSGKPPQTFSSPVKNATAPSLLSAKAASSPALLKQTPKSSTMKQPPPAKAAAGVKEVESSESSESSSESEDEAPSVPVSQKKLQTPQPPAGARQNQIDKPGTLVKASMSALKGKEKEGESSSSSSDSEDEMIPPTAPLSATKANTALQVASATKSLPPPGGPLQKAQESEDSSQDSSDESDSEEDKVFTQKPAQETQKPTPAPVKAPAAKVAGATSGKASNTQPAGKVLTASPKKPAAASLQKAAESSETDSSDSSEDEVVAEKPVKQPPIHPFFLPKAVKTAAPPGKGAQANSSTPNSVSAKSQGPAAVTVGKVEQSSSKKPKLSQAPPDKPSEILKLKESSGSSSSSDSEEEALTTTKQIPQPASIPQKQGVGRKPDSSSEATSSDEEQEASQSLLKGVMGPLKTSLPTLSKGAAPALSKQSSAIGVASGDSSSSDSSDSDTDAKEIVGQKTEIGSLPSTGKEVARAKGATGAAARKKGAGSVSSKATSAKKAATKAQSNGSTKRNPAGQLPPTLLTSTQTVQVGSEEATAAHVPGAAAQGEPQATQVVAVKPPKATKSSKAGAKEKPSKKRKLAAGDAGLDEPKGKKLKAKSGAEVPKKLKKKKKKAKSSEGSETPKKKGSKEKKADKKKKKSKKLESLTEDGSQKKKKKKKKTGDLEGAA